MKYARISVYDHVAEDYDDLARRAEAGMGSILRGLPGFVSYSIGRDQTGRIVALNVWDSHEQAETGLREATTWVRENLGDAVRVVSNHIVDFTFTVQ